LKANTKANGNSQAISGFAPVIYAVDCSVNKSHKNEARESSLEKSNKLPTLLILGTVPSVKSLEQQQYYAHPRNAFWPIMAALFDFDHKQSYEQRVTELIQANIALWDVLASCERPGSLDSQIKATTEKANPIAELLLKYPSINKIACNGKKAHALLIKHFPELKNNYKIFQLPSTSPAHATITLQEKIEQWSVIKLD
jgi:TDG/mug DNA glycosylase family protein